MTKHQATVPKLVEEYFRRWVPGYVEETDLRVSHPLIVQTFVPGRGWKNYPGRKRVSNSWLRKLAQEEGVTVVTLASPVNPRRRPDFAINEVLRAQYRTSAGTTL